MFPSPAAPSSSPAQSGESGWAHFAARVSLDHELFSSLETASDREAFAALAVRLGSSLGFKFTADDALAALTAARHAWLVRNTGFAPSTVAVESTTPPSPHWLPVHLTLPPFVNEPEVEWANFGDIRLTDPFFEQTVGAALRNPARLLFRCRTSFAGIEAMANTVPVLPPAGFVFHLSRCGSTLLAQMLAASPCNRVLSEAPPIDRLLAHDAANPSLTLEQRAARLRGLINAFARLRFPEERHLYIKWDAWHTLHLPVIRAAFPDTPWIFLHREPVEVLVSQRRQRGFQFIPGMMDPRPFGIDPTELASMDFDTYTARVLGASATAAVAALNTPGHRGRAVAYEELPSVFVELVRDHFGVAYEPAELARMAVAGNRNAKNPMLAFTADSEAKRREADDDLRALATRWLDAPHRELLTLGAVARPTPITPIVG